MSFNSILIIVVCFTCAAVFNPLTVHGLHQEMDSGFNPIATVDLASQDFALDYNEVENNEAEVDDIDGNRSLRRDCIKLAATNPITYSSVAPSAEPTDAPFRSCTTTVSNIGTCTLTTILCCDTCTM